MLTHAEEVASGRRFQFGRNWTSFLRRVDRERVAVARASLCDMLECRHLGGKRFLDIGCGSGLFSLAARSLGATVHSFDFDPNSVACTRLLKEQSDPGDPLWTIEEGSVLDAPYLESLGRFDVVYVWGVVHHTGDMWRAMRNSALPLDDKGQLFLALYNDRGRPTRFWRKVKQCYCSGWPGKWLVLGTFIPYFAAAVIVKGLLRLRNPLASWSNYKKHRGMSLGHDWIDWLGGYPFEAASAGEVFEFYRRQGLTLTRLKTVSGNGNHELVFRRLGPTG